jgi:Flp pilus assembly protein TadD
MRPLLASIIALALAASAEGSQTQREIALRHLRDGQEALQQERFEQAERAFKTAIELDWQLELAHYGLGQTYMATRRYVEAVQAYEKCRDVFLSNEADRLSNSVEAERRLDDQIRSLRDLRRGLETGRQRTNNLTATLNQIDSEIRQLEGLRHRGRESAAATPPYILIALGSALFRTNAFPHAEREWRRAIAINSNIGEAHNNLAVLYMLTDRLDEAEKEIALAETAGFKVSPQFKADVKRRRAK